MDHFDWSQPKSHTFLHTFLDFTRSESRSKRYFSPVYVGGVNILGLELCLTSNLIPHTPLIASSRSGQLAPIHAIVYQYEETPYILHTSSNFTPSRELTRDVSGTRFHASGEYNSSSAVFCEQFGTTQPPVGAMPRPVKSSAVYALVCLPNKF